MSSGFHYMGANAGLIPGFSNRGFASGSPVVDAAAAGGPAPGIVAPTAPATELGSGVMTRALARSQGFTGDACGHCGSMKMQVAGHCTVCAECGTTTGCS